MAKRRIGIVGGLSPESTVEYYLHITRTWAARYGNLSYPEIAIYSVDFDRINAWREAGRWDAIAASLADAARALRRAGAELGVISANTMHRVFDEVQAAVDYPFIHILDPSVAAIRKAGLSRVGLLGTKTTMLEPFYAERMAAGGVEALVPEAADAETVHGIIFGKLVRGIVDEESKLAYAGVMARLRARGAQGMLLACTEIPLLVKTDDIDLPLFDTARLHAEAALDRSVAD